MLITDSRKCGKVIILRPESVIILNRNGWSTCSGICKCHNLKHKKGSATRTLNELTPYLENKLTKTTKENLIATVSYFKNNIKAGRMKYYDHVNSHLPIGSGVVEAACKTIVKQRLGASGMRWKDAGMKVILSLRTLVNTKGRWEQFWEKIDNFGSSVAN